MLLCRDPGVWVAGMLSSLPVTLTTLFGVPCFPAEPALSPVAPDREQPLAKHQRCQQTPTGLPAAATTLLPAPSLHEQRFYAVSFPRTLLETACGEPYPGGQIMPMAKAGSETPYRRGHT